MEAANGYTCNLIGIKGDYTTTANDDDDFYNHQKYKETGSEPGLRVAAAGVLLRRLSGLQFR